MEKVGEVVSAKAREASIECEIEIDGELHTHIFGSGTLGDEHTYVPPEEIDEELAQNFVGKPVVIYEYEVV